MALNQIFGYDPLEWIKMICSDDFRMIELGVHCNGDIFHYSYYTQSFHPFIQYILYSTKILAVIKQEISKGAVQISYKKWGYQSHANTTYTIYVLW